MRGRERERVAKTAILMATSGESRCTSLVCSCYAPVKYHSSKSIEGRDGTKGSKGISGKRAGHAGVKGVSHKPCVQPHPVPLKSNLKKPNRLGEQQQQQEVVVMMREGRRKVSWSDAHGRDLAHVQEFYSRFKVTQTFSGSQFVVRLLNQNNLFVVGRYVV